MLKIPKFALYGHDDPRVEEGIQPRLALRSWIDLSDQDRKIAYQQLENSGWVDEYSSKILSTMEYLNHAFLRQCPGRNLHLIKPDRGYQAESHDFKRKEAAFKDFQRILTSTQPDELVLRMLSKFASCHIDSYEYKRASEVVEHTERSKLIESAFEKFDRLANCLNHIFEQFSINQVVTRNGFVPRQDDKIVNDVYEPTLRALSDPKWRPVSRDLARMFNDYRDESYAEAITKAHSAVQRFLQILAGEEGRSGRGEVGKLFQEAKSAKLIPVNRFTEQVVTLIQGFIVSERATNSTSKPALREATASDALLMMNVVIVFLQFCLQGTK